MRWSVQLQVDREVVLDRWHHTCNKFQEYEQTLFHFRFAAIAYDSVYDSLHHLRVVARMYAKLLLVNLRVLFKSDSFVGVVAHNVLVHFFFREQLSVFSVTLQPQSWRSRVKIVGDAQVILPHFFNVIVIVFFALNKLAPCEYVVSCLGFCVWIKVVNVIQFFFRLVTF